MSKQDILNNIIKNASKDRKAGKDKIRTYEDAKRLFCNMELNYEEYERATIKLAKELKI